MKTLIAILQKWSTKSSNLTTVNKETKHNNTKHKLHKDSENIINKSESHLLSNTIHVIRPDRS